MAEVADWIRALLASEGATLSGVGNMTLLMFLVTRIKRTKISWSVIFMVFVLMLLAPLPLALSMFLVHVLELP